nr:MAG TPA: hypothetical protein [Inoviridae sp.]
MRIDSQMHQLCLHRLVFLTVYSRSTATTTERSSGV